MLVADLLAQSRAAHQDAKRCRREARIDDGCDALRLAQRLRLKAHAKDPDHLEQAWLEDANQKFDHAACLTFYASELDKNPVKEREKARARLQKAREVVAASVAGPS